MEKSIGTFLSELLNDRIMKWPIRITCLLILAFLIYLMGLWVYRDYKGNDNNVETKTDTAYLQKPVHVDSTIKPVTPNQNKPSPRQSAPTIPETQIQNIQSPNIHIHGANSGDIKITYNNNGIRQRHPTEAGLVKFVKLNVKNKQIQIVKHTDDGESEIFASEIAQGLIRKGQNVRIGTHLFSGIPHPIDFDTQTGYYKDSTLKIAIWDQLPK